MKDDAVERVLMGLARVGTPAGLEGRVLRRMAEREKRRPDVWGWGFGIVAGMALVGGLAWNFAMSGHMGGGHTPGAKARVLDKGERPKAEALGYLQATAKSADAVVTERGEHTRGAGARTGGGAERPKAEALGYLQAKAKPGELESFPAPPEPLTEQERLLRQIALTGSKPAFELLNEETREAALAASDAEFEVFVRSAHSAGRSDGRKSGKLEFER